MMTITNSNWASLGVLEVETTAAGTDNSLTTLVDLVEKAQAEKGDRAGTRATTHS